MAVREPAKPIDPNSVGGRLRALRKEKGYTQVVVANCVGIKNTALANYENNTREPNFETIKKLADFYNAPAQWVIFGEEIDTKAITPEMLDLVDKIKILSDKERRLLSFVLGDQE